MTIFGLRRFAASSLLFVMMTVSACTFGPGQNTEPVTAPAPEAESIKPDPTLKALDASARVETQVPGFDPVLENDPLRLYIKRETTEIAVLDKRSGNIWRSNPDASQDKLASPYLKGKLSSQISFVYLTDNGQNKDYDSYNHSVKFKQFEIKQSETDVTVTYQFGNPEKGLESIPAKVSKQRFEERLLGRLTDKGDQEELKKRYKFIEGQNVWERREIPKAVVKKLLALFEKLEYTEEDLAIDNEETGVEGGAESANPKFSAAIRYTLDGENLVATVDTSSIKEDTPPYRIHTLNVLEYFGAAGKEDKGYMFLPDGSGTLVELNNDRKLSQPILMPIYGEDSALYVREKFNTIQPNRLPVFGIKKNDAAFLAVIEEGDGLAWLSADISGRLHEFNTVSPQFMVLPKDEVRLSNNEIMHKTPKQMYRGKLRIRYSFLSGEQSDYSGMAASYRSYLEKKYGMKKLKAEGDTPFYLELAGGIPKKKNFLGYAYETVVALTDLKEAAVIVDQLNANQIRNIRLNYKGWFNHGLNHDYASNIYMERVIGSKREWQTLAEKLQNSGGGFYPDAAFLHVYRDTWGFSPSQDSAQHISRRYAKIFKFDKAAYFRSEFSHYLLSPRKLESAVGGFLSDYKQFNPGTISLRDLGSELHSDFRRIGEVNREDAKRIAAGQLQRIHEQAPDIMVNGGNAYALPFASHVLNVPDRSNEYQLAGESIPFNQMVLHGYVDFAGKPYNLADDQDVRINMLRSLETGGSVYFNWFYENPSVLKETQFNHLYSSHYKQWLDEAVEAYEQVNAVLKKVRGQSITEHQKLADRVFKTQYENGLSVIVNYGSKPVSVEGDTVDAKDYVVKGG